MKPQSLILLFGHNAAGKTTLAKKLEKTFELNVVNGDVIREMLIKNIKYYSKTHNSFPNERIATANKIVDICREETIKELLSQNQSILLDGGGITKEKRKEYLKLKKYSKREVVTIIIEVIIDEKILIERLKFRDKKNAKFKWLKFYKKIRKKRYEAVEEKEADYILIYNQKNYRELVDSLKKVLK